MYLKANYQQRGLMKESLLFKISLSMYGKISRINRNLSFLAMKITIVLLFSACLTASAGGLPQKVTLSQKNVKLEKVFREISKQTGYIFFYDTKVLSGARSVSIDLKDASVEEALEEMLQGLPLDFSIVRKTITILEKPLIVKPMNILATAPLKIITGSVKDENGNSLAGVSVIIKGTNKGTSTDANGRFTIEANVGDVLEFTFVGYQKRTVVVGANTNLIIQMEVEAVRGNEVVITAYGKVKKQNLTDAVSSIDGEKLQDRPLRTLADGLVGLAPGLNVNIPSGAPEATPSLNIRGFTTINNTGAPLVLIDGIERPIQDVNPNDVESISVLKDAASTTIYGSRAPYGIILITTKSGKAGKLSVNYSSNYTFGVPEFMPKKLPSYEWAALINQVMMSNPNGTGVALYTDLTIQRMKAWAAGDFDNTVFNGIDKKYVIGGQFPDPTSNYGYNTNGAYANDDYFKAYFKDVIPSYQQNINFSGGTERVNYYVGLGYNSTNGIIRNFDNYNRRYNALSKITFKAANWLDLDASMNYVRSGYQEANYRGQGIDYFSVFNTIAREFYNVPIKNPDNPNYYTAVVSLGTVQGQGGLVTNTNSDLTFTGGFTLKPIKDLNIVGSYTFRNNNDQNATSQKIIYRYMPDGTVLPGLRTANTSAEYKTFGTQDYQFYKLTADYAKTIADEHHLFMQVGVQAEENKFSSLSGSGQGLFAQEAVTTISTTAGTYAASDRLYDWATLGYYGVLTYDYSEKYMLKLAARTDASSRFSPNARWGFFPSISGGWNAAKENFWPLKDWITVFKPRASWSKSGDLASAGVDNYYTYLPTLSFGTSTQTLLGGNFATYANPPGLVSNSLTWAKPTMLDFGIDISALKSRLSLTADWYQRTIYDQAGPPDPIAQTLGTGAPSTNNSVSETRGWEFSIGWNDNFKVAGKPFKYGLSFLMSDYVGYVVKYSPNKTGARNGGWTPGEVFGVNYVYKADKIIQNTADLNSSVLNQNYNYPGYLTYQDLNGDGYINGGDGTGWYSLGDLVADGYNYPRKTYSILPSFSWNNISVSAVFEGVMQWKQFINDIYVFGTNGSQFFSPFYEQSAKLGYWNTNNTGAFFPAVTQGTTPNDRYIVNLANLRIRNITLGYDLPQNWLKKAKLQRVNVYVSGENIGFIYLKSFVKYDPNLLNAGPEGYMPLRNYSFGLNITL
jgi:TonB-linked SusC/RagA family outer membrane protein